MTPLHLVDLVRTGGLPLSCAACRRPVRRYALVGRSTAGAAAGRLALHPECGRALAVAVLAALAAGLDDLAPDPPRTMGRLCALPHTRRKGT